MIIRIHELRENRRSFLELADADLPAVYGKCLPTLERGQVVVMGGTLHKIYRKTASACATVAPCDPHDNPRKTT